MCVAQQYFHWSDQPAQSWTSYKLQEAANWRCKIENQIIGFLVAKRTVVLQSIAELLLGFCKFRMNWHTMAVNRRGFFQVCTVNCAYCGPTTMRCLQMQPFATPPGRCKEKLRYGVQNGWHSVWPRKYPQQRSLFPHRVRFSVGHPKRDCYAGWSDCERELVKAGNCSECRVVSDFYLFYWGACVAKRLICRQCQFMLRLPKIAQLIKFPSNPKTVGPPLKFCAREFVFTCVQSRGSFAV